MTQCAKQMIEAKINQIEGKLMPMRVELMKIAGVFGKITDFWLLDEQIKELDGQLKGIDFVLKQLGLTRMLNEGRWVVVDEKTFHHMIGWDQFEGGAEK